MAKGEINKAAGEMPKSGHMRPAGPSKGNNVGNETKADVKGTQEGGSMAEAANNPLRGAVQHLHTEHPIAYHEHGPHHDTDHHRTHMPLHGMKPSSK